VAPVVSEQRTPNPQVPGWSPGGPHQIRGRGTGPPCDDASPRLWTYADAALDAIGDRTELLVVGQSFGGFTAQLIYDRTAVDVLVLVADMIPSPGLNVVVAGGDESSSYSACLLHVSRIRPPILGASPRGPRFGDPIAHPVRQLFRKHCLATPEPMSHLRMGGMHRRIMGGFRDTAPSRENC
jgi:pimeloyl-ACP methyl ester carboxylesterase